MYPPNELSILTPLQLAQIKWVKESYPEDELKLIIGKAIPLQSITVEDRTSAKEVEKEAELAEAQGKSYPVIALHQMDYNQTTWSRIIFMRGGNHITKGEECTDLSLLFSPKCWNNHLLVWYIAIDFERVDLDDAPVSTPEIEDLLDVWKLQAASKLSEVFGVSLGTA